MYLLFSSNSLNNYSLVVFSDVLNETYVAFITLEAKGNVFHRYLLFKNVLICCFTFRKQRPFINLSLTNLLSTELSSRWKYATSLVQSISSKNGYDTNFLRVVLFLCTIMNNLQRDLARTPIVHANSIYNSDYIVFLGWGRSSKNQDSI